MSQRSSAPSLSRTDEGGNPRRLETCHAPDENVYIQMLCCVVDFFFFFFWGEGDWVALL